MKKRRIWISVAIVLVVLVGAGFALWEYHEQPQFCVICHIMQPYLDSWESSSMPVAIHAAEGITCLECHEPTIKQQINEVIVFVTGDYKIPLRERKLPKEKCFECHDNYEVLIPLTEEGFERNPHNSHWGEMECHICHNMHRDSVDYCAQCHDPVTDAPGWVLPES